VNVGWAITEGMRADRLLDLNRACSGGWGWSVVYVMRAWCWWGWSVSGVGGLGYPGVAFGGSWP